MWAAHLLLFFSPQGEGVASVAICQPFHNYEYALYSTDPPTPGGDKKTSTHCIYGHWPGGKFLGIYEAASRVDSTPDSETSFRTLSLLVISVVS